MLRQNGADGQGLLIAGDRLIQFTKGPERGPEVVVRLRVIGSDGKGPRYEINGRVVLDPNGGPSHQV